MNVKQLEIFVAIVETGSFSKGAELACLTQSTASQHVAALESDCGMRLLDRTGRGAVPTAAGKVLLGHARKVLASLQVANQAMQRLGKIEEVSLSLAASTIPGTYLVPLAIAALRSEHPTVTVTVMMGDSAVALEKLADGLVEVAVLGSPVKDKRVVGEAIGHDRIILVAPPDHRWQQISLHELADEPLVLRESGSGTGTVVHTSLVAAGGDPDKLRAGVVLESSEAVKQAVLAGCGVAFLSEVAVRGELATGALREIPVAGLVIERAFTLATRRGSSLSPTAEKFCQLLRRVSAP